MAIVVMMVVVVTDTVPNMQLYLAGNFVIMGKKEKEEAFQKALDFECCRLASFFYKKEIDIVVQLKGEELNEGKEKVSKKGIKAKRISNSATRESRVARPRKILRKKRRS